MSVRPAAFQAINAVLRANAKPLPAPLLPDGRLLPVRPGPCQLPRPCAGGMPAKFRAEGSMAE